MGIYSTHDYLTREQIIEEIEKRVPDLNKMANERLVNILEAMCQVPYNGDWDEPELSDPLAYNNFWTPNEEK